MDDPQRGVRISLTLQAIFGVATMAGLLFTVFAGQTLVAWTVSVIAALATVVCYSYIYFATTKGNKVSFENEDDSKFIDFFSEWYKQPGTHVVFCKDLDWLDKPNRAAIPSTLAAQRDRATIILSEDRAEACSTIRSHGGIVTVIPEDVAAIRVKLSIHTDDNDSKRMIVQLKSGARATPIKFRRTNDTVMIALAETLIAACKHISANHQNGAAIMPESMP